MKQSVSNLSVNFKVNFDYSINSGQVFLWKKIDAKWYGIDGKRVLVLENAQKFKKNMKYETDFFRLDDNFEKISNDLKNDNYVRNALKMFPGLRLIRQNPFQCYISFIVSSNSNIPNIKSRLQNLCKTFGRRKMVDGKEFFLFPEPSDLANASVLDIKKCGLGYRAKAVKTASLSVLDKKIDFDFLKKIDYHTAKEELIKVFGIGNKVADCILLFSLEKLEAFPLDRWMLRILQKYYSKEFQISTKTLTEKTYDQLHENIVEHFGSYAGYAQQFLFKMERDIYKKKWL
jgi:N-glycosylase/DNA lyase